MPSWEWRVFFPCGSSDTVPSELWSLLGARHSRGSVEHRTDVYLTCTAGAGLKLRGGSGVEVKLRQDRDSSEGTERWKKVVVTSFPKRANDKDPSVVCRVFSKELHSVIVKDGLKDSLGEAFTALQSPQSLVTVTKARVKQHVRALCVDSVEEAIVTVSSGDVTVWKSVCLEASRAEDVSKALSTKVKVHGSSEEVTLKHYLLTLKDGVVMSYPEFVISKGRTVQ